MLGAVAGDIIGSPYEWSNTGDRYFELGRGTRGWYRGREVTYHPRFTDDTVMTLAVARWLMSDKDMNASRLISIMQSMGQEYIDRGFAPMFRKWIESDQPHPYSSLDNGAATRVSPVALTAHSLPEAITVARMAAEVSHAHPEEIKGAEAMAQAVWMAQHGRSRGDIRFAISHDYGYDLSMPEDEMMSLLAGCIKEPEKTRDSSISVKQEGLIIPARTLCRQPSGPFWQATASRMPSGEPSHLAVILTP